MTRNFLTPLFVFLTATFVCGADLVEYRSQAYRISTDLPKPLVQEIGKHMDLVFAEYSARFSGFAARAGGSQPLYVFAREREYLDFLKSHGVDGRGSHGLFFVNESGSGLVAFLERQTYDRLLHTLRHEGFHQFAYSRIGPRLPTWLNEGLAEYFALSIIVRGRIEPGQVPLDRLLHVKEALRDGGLIPLPQLMGMTSAGWSRGVVGGDARMQYLQSWSIVHFLIHGDDDRYRGAFDKYLRIVANGTDSDSAFVTAFGRNSYQAFEERWKKYLLAIKPTPEFVAAQRLEFLAQGIRWLIEQGQKVESLDGLRDALRKADFSVREAAPGGYAMEFRARDADNFEPPVPTGKFGKPTMELTPSLDEKLPPGVLVKGLRVPVRLVWQSGEGGQLLSRVIYE